LRTEFRTQRDVDQAPPLWAQRFRVPPPASSTLPPHPIEADRAVSSNVDFMRVCMGTRHITLRTDLRTWVARSPLRTAIPRGLPRFLHALSPPTRSWPCLFMKCWFYADLHGNCARTRVRVFFSSSLLLPSPELSDTKVNETLRALLGTAAYFCKVVVLQFHMQTLIIHKLVHNRTTRHLL
jgi:hypothetical protein